jgi:hypothetical protein
LFFTWFLSSLFILLAFSEFRGDIYLKFIHIKSKIFKQN